MIQNTARKWFAKHMKSGLMYRNLSWRFQEENAYWKKITEQQYINYYVHPNDRWKI